MATKNLRTPSPLALNVIAKRKAKGLTRTQLAGLAGIQENTLGKLERGDILAPNLDTIASLARALGCTIDELRGTL